MRGKIGCRAEGAERGSSGSASLSGCASMVGRYSQMMLASQTVCVAATYEGQTCLEFAAVAWSFFAPPDSIHPRCN